MTISSLNHLTLSVSNIDTSFSFYHKVLEFKPLVKWHQGAYFLVEDLWFCLSEDPEFSQERGYTHYAFSVSKKHFTAVVNRLKQHGCESFQDNTSPGDSFYFLDPDGHQLEIHTGTYQDRLEAKKNNPGSWSDITWYV